MAANVMRTARHTDMVMTADGKPTWWAKMAPGQNIVVSTLQDMESALTLSSLDWATLTEIRQNGVPHYDGIPSFARKRKSREFIARDLTF